MLNPFSWISFGLCRQVKLLMPWKSTLHKLSTRFSSIYVPESWKFWLLGRMPQSKADDQWIHRLQFYLLNINMENAFLKSIYILLYIYIFSCDPLKAVLRAIRPGSQYGFDITDLYDYCLKCEFHGNWNDFNKLIWFFVYESSIFSTL